MVEIGLGEVAAVTVGLLVLFVIIILGYRFVTTKMKNLSPDLTIQSSRIFLRIKEDVDTFTLDSTISYLETLKEQRSTVKKER